MRGSSYVRESSGDLSNGGIFYRGNVLKISHCGEVKKEKQSAVFCSILSSILAIKFSHRELHYYASSRPQICSRKLLSPTTHFRFLLLLTHWHFRFSDLHINPKIKIIHSHALSTELLLLCFLVFVAKNRSTSFTLLYSSLLNIIYVHVLSIALSPPSSTRFILDSRAPLPVQLRKSCTSTEGEELLQLPRVPGGFHHLGRIISP